MKKFVLFVLLLCYSCFIQGQKLNTSKIDSLQKILAKTDNTSEKSKILLLLAKQQLNLYNIDESKKYTDELLKLSKDLNDSLSIGRSYQLLATQNVLKSDFPKAIKYFYLAIPILKKYEDFEELTICYANIGKLYVDTGDLELAKKANFNSLKYANITNNKKRISFLYGKIAGIYSLQNIIDSAFYYTNKGIEIDKINNFNINEAYKHNLLSELYKKEKDYANAFASLRKGLLLNKKIQDYYLQMNIYTEMAKLYSEPNIRNLDSVYFFLKKTKEIIVDKPGLFTEKKIIYENLSETSLELKNYKAAYNELKLAKQYADSLLNKEKSKQIIETEAKFKTAQKDKEIAQQKLQLEKERSQRNKLIFGSLALLLLGFTGFQWRNSIQKRKKLFAENKLKNEKEINELRTKFLGNIAHEIRTPLTLISGNLELAKENIDKKEKALQNIDVALVNSKKVVEDANEILELLKFEKNKTTIKLNTVNLNQTLKRIFLSFASLAEMKHLTLDYQSNIPENVTAKIDVDKVEKILNNLISNAIKYSPANNKIIFDAQLSQDQLTVKVTDFGQGIHFNETEKIFERFYQSSQSNAVGGIGIGLSLAKEFAELLNGSLTVESELGNGSTFVFNLPVEITSSQTQEVENITPARRKVVENNVSLPEDTPVTPQNKEKPNILIVEDNPEMCNYIVEILKDIYHCDIAFDGMEALEKVKSNSYDLITSDIMMPRLDGFQLREKLNENDNLKNIPFILISAKTLPEDKIKGFSLGIDDYVVKPFNKNELIARIDNLLINKKDREQWLQENEPVDESLDTSEKQLLSKIEETVINNISNEEFKVAQLASEIGYSQRQLTRILKQYTGMSPVKFILEIRLQKAYKLLQSKSFFTLSEVRFDVGIPSSSYFNRKFKERFGISPSELL